MSAKIVAISDIHGHYDQMMEVMDKLQDEIEFMTDTVVFLGDYVDGGPDTKKVLDQLIEYKKQYPHWKFLYGNHEDLLLDAFDPTHPVYGDYYLWWNQGGKATLDSFSRVIKDRYQRSIMQPEDLIHHKYTGFMHSLDRFYETDEYFFVHAGVWPGVSLKEQIEKLGDGQEDSFAYDFIWLRDVFIKSPFDWGKKIIFGHTTFPNAKPLIMSNKIGLDTMNHNWGKITAVVLPEEKVIQSSLLE